MYIHVNNNSKGICLASWKSLRDYQRITSSEPLCFVVPGHFVKRDGDEELDKLKWRHDELILSGKVGHPMAKKVTLFDITGRDPPEKIGGKEEDDGGVKGDALREVLLRAVFKYMAPQEMKEVEKDVVAFMKGKVLNNKKFDSIHAYGIVKRNEYVEEIVKMKTEDANSLISNQLDHNKCGLFFREVIRPGSYVAKNIKEDSIILWSKDNRSLADLTGICRDAGAGQAFIVFRPGEQSSLGIRVRNGSIAQVRAKMLKGDSLPNDESMAVKGRHVYIVDGLPEAFDPREVATFLGKKGWFVLVGSAKNLKSTQVRVLADQGPPSKIYPNVSTGKNIFIYEEGKKWKDDEKEEEEKEVEKEGSDETRKMDWEPPPLFEEEELGKQSDQQNSAKQVPPNTAKAVTHAPLRSSVSSSSSSSASKVVPIVASVVDEKRMEEEKKRMDVMEKEMVDLKSKMASLEQNITKNNEDISTKFTALEQQQQATNVDIKSMFAQLISEMGAIKSTMSTTLSTAPTEQERKKARVDSPAPTN